MFLDYTLFLWVGGTVKILSQANTPPPMSTIASMWAMWTMCRRAGERASGRAGERASAAATWPAPNATGRVKNRRACRACKVGPWPPLYVCGPCGPCGPCVFFGRAPPNILYLYIYLLFYKLSKIIAHMAHIVLKPLIYKPFLWATSIAHTHPHMPTNKGLSLCTIVR